MLISFLMHRVELKEQPKHREKKKRKQSVPNAPCGVERHLAR
jgi:hypothetical protein